MTVLTEIETVRREAELLYGAREIRGAIERMAGEAAKLLAGRCPVVVPIMLGGAFTAVHLCGHFDFAYELDCVHVGRYGDGLSGGALSWSLKPRLDLAGRAVLLVDDVLDRGLTLTEVMREIAGLGVADLRVAVLASKRIDGGAERPHVDFIGVECPDRYLFGCGMDYKGFWRGLPELYAVPDDGF